MSETLLTAAQMRALEAAAIASGAVTGLDLMERAGRGALAAIAAEWPDLAATPKRAMVLCGPGNNGGDGFVVARLLAGQAWEVEVLLYGDEGRLPPDARTNFERWKEMGPVRPLTGREIDGSTQATDLLVDALFGTGLARALPPDLRDAISRVAAALPHRARVVALDIPSGLSADTGRNLSNGEADPAAPLRADLTLAFHAPKVGHYLGDAPAACGLLRVVGIGLQDGPGDTTIARRLTAPIANIAKIRGHKYAHGHALVLAGGFGRTGAARLAARAALRIGAGLVTVAAPGSAMMECATQLTAIMLRRCDDAATLETLLEDERLNALCLGPGLGTDARAAGLVATALAARRATILDADALTLIAGDDALRRALHPDCVLTPHGGEFARLFPDIASRLDEPAASSAFSKVDATREAAGQAGCTVLLKGPDTVIADPSGRASVNSAAYDRAAPWLATAGSGDVLAGLVAGLLARGLAPHEAAASAAWLHVETARAFGPGLVAEDLPETLPAVLRALR